MKKLIIYESITNGMLPDRDSHRETRKELRDRAIKDCKKIEDFTKEDQEELDNPNIQWSYEKELLNKKDRYNSKLLLIKKYKIKPSELE